MNPWTAMFFYFSPRPWVSHSWSVSPIRMAEVTFTQAFSRFWIWMRCSSWLRDILQHWKFVINFSVLLRTFYFFLAKVFRKLLEKFKFFVSRTQGKDPEIPLRKSAYSFTIWDRDNFRRERLHPPHQYWKPQFPFSSNLQYKCCMKAKSICLSQFFFWNLKNVSEFQTAIRCAPLTPLGIEIKWNEWSKNTFVTIKYNSNCSWWIL